MSFAAAVKDDLCRIAMHKKCCLLAEFSAFLLLNGSMRITPGAGISLSMLTEHSGTARRIFSLAKEVFEMDTQISVHRKDRLRKNQVFSLLMPHQEGVTRALSALGFNTGAEFWEMTTPPEPPAALCESQCCCRAYLRGAFLAGGSVNNPKSTYHLEIVCNSRAQADFITGLAAGFDIAGHAVQRKNSWIFYLKESDRIITFLNVIGSHRALLDFENVRIEKDMRNRVNRLVNSEAANINKQVQAAQAQLADIKKIALTIGLAKLPLSLRQTAEARVNNPEASLTELSALLSVGKSGVSHRLRRISEIADDIESGIKSV